MGMTKYKYSDIKVLTFQNNWQLHLVYSRNEEVNYYSIIPESILNSIGYKLVENSLTKSLPPQWKLTRFTEKLGYSMLRRLGSE